MNENFVPEPDADFKGVLAHLLQWPMPLPEANGDSIEKWVRAAAEEPGEWIQSRTPDEVRRALRSIGLIVEPRGETPHIAFAHGHPWLEACYLETPWRGQWGRILSEEGRAKFSHSKTFNAWTGAALSFPLSAALADL